MDDSNISQLPAINSFPATEGYQREMLVESLGKNLIIALDSGAGKIHIAILRMKIEVEREVKKVIICSLQYIIMIISL